MGMWRNDNGRSTQSSRERTRRLLWGGAEEPFVFTISVNPSDFSDVSDKTYSEIVDALESGKAVIARIEDLYGNVTIATRIAQSQQPQAIIVDDIFAFIEQNGGISDSGTYVRRAIKSDNTITNSVKSISW